LELKIPLSLSLRCERSIDASFSGSQRQRRERSSSLPLSLSLVLVGDKTLISSLSLWCQEGLSLNTDYANSNFITLLKDLRIGTTAQLNIASPPPLPFFLLVQFDDLKSLCQPVRSLLIWLITEPLIAVSAITSLELMARCRPPCPIRSAHQGFNKALLRRPFSSRIGQTG
jgi:hypothetical protein